MLIPKLSPRHSFFCISTVEIATIGISLTLKISNRGWGFSIHFIPSARINIKCSNTFKARRFLIKGRALLLIVFKLFSSENFRQSCIGRRGWEIVSKLLLFIESEFLWRKHFGAKFYFFDTDWWEQWIISEVFGSVRLWQYIKQQRQIKKRLCATFSETMLSPKRRCFLDLG